MFRKEVVKMSLKRKIVALLATVAMSAQFVAVPIASAEERFKLTCGFETLVNGTSGWGDKLSSTYDGVALGDAESFADELSTEAAYSGTYGVKIDTRANTGDTRAYFTEPGYGPWPTEYYVRMSFKVKNLGTSAFDLILKESNLQTAALYTINVPANGEWQTFDTTITLKGNAGWNRILNLQLPAGVVFGMDDLVIEHVEEPVLKFSQTSGFETLVTSTSSWGDGLKSTYDGVAMGDAENFADSLSTDAAYSGTYGAKIDATANSATQRIYFEEPGYGTWPTQYYSKISLKVKNLGTKAANIELKIDGTTNPTVQSVSLPVGGEWKTLEKVVALKGNSGWKRAFNIMIPAGTIIGIDDLVIEDYSKWQPNIVKSYPENGQTNVAPFDPFTVTFDVNMNLDTLNAVKLYDAKNNEVAATVTSSNATNGLSTLSIVPAAMLASNATYKIDLSGVKELYHSTALAAADQTISFTTTATAMSGDEILYYDFEDEAFGNYGVTHGINNQWQSSIERVVADGDYALKVTPNGGDGVFLMNIPKLDGTQYAGNAYKLNMHLKNGTPGKTYAFYVQYYDVNGTGKLPLKATGYEVSENWEMINWTFTIDETAAIYNPTLYISVPNGTELFVDDIIIEKVVEPTMSVNAADGKAVVTYDHLSHADYKGFVAFYDEGRLVKVASEIVNSANKVIETAIPATVGVCTVKAFLWENSDNFVPVLSTQETSVAATVVDNEAALLAAGKTGGNVKLAGDIVLSEGLVVENNLTIDLNGYTIENTTPLWDEESKVYAVITVTDGTLIMSDSSAEKTGTVASLENDSYAIDVWGENGKVVINSGNYIGNLSAIYLKEGTATINGGHFDLLQKYNGESRYLLNAYDANDSAIFTVYGGEFVGFDPATSICGTGEVVLGAGCTSTLNNGVYTVAK